MTSHKQNTKIISVPFPETVTTTNSTHFPFSTPHSQALSHI